MPFRNRPFVTLVLALGIGTTGGAHAQEDVYSFENVVWRAYSQAECMRLGRSSIERGLEELGAEGSVFDEGGWRLVMEGDGLNVVLYCVADDDTPALYSRDAERVLVTVVASSIDPDLARQMRNVVADCVEGAPCSAAEPGALPRPVEWYHTALYFDAPQGASFEVRCPPRAASRDGQIWGTEVYTIDSALCVAALHAGLVGEDGGAIGVVLSGPQDAFAASERNGVRSGDRPGEAESIRIVPAGQ